VKHTPPPNLGPLFAATVKESLTVAPHNGTATSKAAAAAKTNAATDREVMLRTYRNAGKVGRTDDEMHILTELNPDSIRPRRGELIRAGLVKETSMTRKTRKGCMATVYVAKEFHT
jgi:hypothetical protein